MQDEVNEKTVSLCIRLCRRFLSGKDADRRKLGDVVGIDADELALLLDIGDDVVDGDFRSSTGGGGDCDGILKKIFPITYMCCC